MMKALLILAAYSAAALCIYLQNNIQYSTGIGDMQALSVVICSFFSLYYLIVKQSMSGILFIFPAFVLAGGHENNIILSAGSFITRSLAGY